MKIEKPVIITMTQKEFNQLKKVFSHGTELADALTEREPRSIEEKIALSEKWSNLADPIASFLEES